MPLSSKNLEGASVHLGAGISSASAFETTAASYQLPTQSKELSWLVTVSKTE